MSLHATLSPPRSRQHDACQYHSVETALGVVTLVWTERGLCGLLLPATDPDAARSVRFPRAEEGLAPPAWIVELAAQIQGHLSGEPAGYTELPLDLAGLTDFQRRVLEAIRAIPPGETRSYGQIATAIGKPGAARAVGGALGRNPVPLVVPCHRVLARGGRAGGFTAPGGLTTKRALLATEGYVLD